MRMLGNGKSTEEVTCEVCVLFYSDTSKALTREQPRSRLNNTHPYPVVFALVQSPVDEIFLALSQTSFSQNF